MGLRQTAFMQFGARTPPPTSRIPTTLICAIATAASMSWLHTTSQQQGWTRGEIHPGFGWRSSAGTTSTKPGVDFPPCPAQVWVEELSEHYFDALKPHPYLGRFLHVPPDPGGDHPPQILLRR